jgi:hypothetical protein
LYEGKHYPACLDLDRDDRLDVTLRAATMLTRENQAERARELVFAALKQSTSHSDDNINALLDQLEETASGDDSLRTVLNRLTGDTALPRIARVIIRDRQVQDICDRELPDQAGALLREALTTEKGVAGCRRSRLTSDAATCPSADALVLDVGRTEANLNSA